MGMECNDVVGVPYGMWNAVVDAQTVHMDSLHRHDCIHACTNGEF